MSGPVTRNRQATHGKRVQADICPVCGGTVLAPQSVDLHISHDHQDVCPCGRAGKGDLGQVFIDPDCPAHSA